uniref:Peptidase M41 domain-containing protein n=2 Tax=Meloidogyne TaxID=189290 RepID=A0A914NR20_MELIC
MSAIIWLLCLIGLLILMSIVLILFFLVKIDGEDEKFDEQKEEPKQIYYEEINDEYEEDKNEERQIIINEENNAEDEQTTKKAKFNYDDFKFELKFNEDEILAATGEEVMEDEMTLECFADKKAATEPSFSDEEMRRLALHETGHVFIALALGVKLKKVTLKADDVLLGHTTFTFGKKIYTSSDKDNYMSILLGGYCAEMYFLKEPSILSSSDLAKVRDVALSKGATFAFDGKPARWIVRKNCTEALRKEREDIIYKNVDECTERVKKLIKEHEEEIGEFADTLCKKIELKGEHLYKEINKLKKKYKKNNRWMEKNKRIEFSC